MSMSILRNFKFTSNQTGSALVVAMIVLAILGALGLAALDVADLNIFISANDRDSKGTFFHADSGVNVGHEFLEGAIDDVNSTFYGNNATDWLSQTFADFNSTADLNSTNSLSIYAIGTQATSVRSGILARGYMEGSAMQIGAGYEGAGKSAAHGGTFTTFLIRSHREGARNSVAEVDMGWRHIN